MKDKNTKSRAFAIFYRGDVYAVIIADSPEEAAKIFRGELVSRLDKKSKQFGLYTGEMLLPAHIFYGLNPHDDGEGYEIYDGFEWLCQNKPTGIKASNFDFEKNYGLLVRIKEIPVFKKKKEQKY